MENRLYYVESPDGQVLGPMTMIHILEGIAAGVIYESARLCEVGSDRWIGISEVAHTRTEEPGAARFGASPPRAGTPERSPGFTPPVRPPSTDVAVPVPSGVDDDELVLDHSPPGPLREPPGLRPADDWDDLELDPPFPVAETEPLLPSEPASLEISLDDLDADTGTREEDPPRAVPLWASDLRTLEPSTEEKRTFEEPEDVPLSARPLEQPTAGVGDFSLGESYVTEEEPETDWRAELEPPPRPKKRWLGPTIAIAILVPVAAAVYWLAGAGGRGKTSPATVRHAPRPAPAAEQTPLDRGWDLLRRGQAGEAIIAFQQAVDASPENAAAQHGLGRAAFDAGKTKVALRHLEEAARLEPNSAQYVVDLAYGKLSAGEYDLALAAARRALELAPDDPTGHLIVGRALAATGKHDDAVRSLSTYVEAVPDDLQARLDLARSLTAAGRTEAAIPEVNRFLEAFPDDKSAQHERLQWMQSVGRSAEAAVLYSTLAGKHPDNAWFLYLAGIANPGEEGVVHLRASVALAPGNGDAWALLGTYLTKLGRHDEAVAAFEKAFERRPASPEEFELLSQAKSAARKPKPEPPRVQPRTIDETRELKSAIELIRSALAGGSHSRARKSLDVARADLRSIDARRNLTLWAGIIALEAGDFEQALEHFGGLPEDASFRESGFGVGAVRNWIARTHLSQGDLRSAITVFDYVTTDDPNEFAFARLWEGVALSSLGMDDLARRTWRRISDEVAGLVGRSGQAAMLSATYLLGDISEARYRENVAGLGGGFENDMHFLLGFAAKRDGDPARARIHYMRSLEATQGREFPWYLAQDEAEGDGLAPR